MNAPRPIGYIPAIDGLRAVAVVSVIVFHLWPARLPGGFTGVDIFFVISGFVVTGAMLGRRFDSLKTLLTWFYARRLLRILPALAAMLLATTLAANLFIPDAWLSRTLPATGVAAFAGLSNIVLAFATGSYFGPLPSYNPFTHTWSLGVEEQFYLLFPFLVFWHQRVHARAAVVVAGLSVASLLTAVAMRSATPSLAYFLIVPRFWELGVGMLLCLTVERWRPRIGARAGAALALAGVLLVATGLTLPQAGWSPFPGALPPVLGTAALIAAVVARPQGLAARLLALPPMVATGLLSYSLYLWHWPVIVLFRWTLGVEALRWQLLALGIAVMLAILSYLLIERPVRTSARIDAAPRGRLVLAALAVMLAGGAASAAAFHLHDRITLSVTRDRAAWYPDADRPLDPDLTHCRVRTARQKLGGMTAEGWIGDSCGKPAFTIYAIGDSHNQAYAPSYRQFAADAGVAVWSLTRSGCPLVKLIETLPPGCAAALEPLYADLAARVRPGDVIFLPALRQTQLPEGPGSAGQGEAPDPVPPEALAQARAALARLAATGARIIVEAPKPLFHAAPFRCADWFNRRNPACAGGLRMEATTLERRRQPVLDALTLLAAEQPAVRIYDPFPSLCQGSVCDALWNDKPLFFDAHHLSGEGNDAVYVNLRERFFGTED